MDSIARAKWAVCEIREDTRLRARLTPKIDEHGHLFVEDVGTAKWWLQLAERISVGFDASTGEVCEFDTWAGVASSLHADWSPRAAIRTGAVVSLHNGDAGVIYDYLDGDDYYDPRVGVWWAGSADQVGIWIRIAPAVLIGCQVAPGEETTIVSVAIDLRVLDESSEQGASSSTRRSVRE